MIADTERALIEANPRFKVLYDRLPQDSRTIFGQLDSDLQTIAILSGKSGVLRQIISDYMEQKGHTHWDRTLADYDDAMKVGRRSWGAPAVALSAALAVGGIATGFYHSVFNLSSLANSSPPLAPLLHSPPPEPEPLPSHPLPPPIPEPIAPPPAVEAPQPYVVPSLRPEGLAEKAALDELIAQWKAGNDEHRAKYREIRASFEQRRTAIEEKKRLQQEQPAVVSPHAEPTHVTLASSTAPLERVVEKSAEGLCEAAVAKHESIYGKVKGLGKFVSAMERTYHNTSNPFGFSDARLKELGYQRSTMTEQDHYDAACLSLIKTHIYLSTRKTSLSGFGETTISKQERAKYTLLAHYWGQTRIGNMIASGYGFEKARDFVAHLEGLANETQGDTVYIRNDDGTFITRMSKKQIRLGSAFYRTVIGEFGK